jgi:hypothetical protein
MPSPTERSASPAQHRFLLLLLRGQNLASKNPNFNADDSVGGARLGEAIADIGAQSV